MKTLTLSALLCAMMALTRAAALPDTEDEPGTEGTVVQALPDTEAGNWTDSFTPTGESHVVKRSISCPWGWTAINGRCFLYVPQALIWAGAEINCQYFGGHLASVHNIQEYHEIQAMIVRATHYHEVAWIGGSDAEQEGLWFWSDGTPFNFAQWCPGEPSNGSGHQRCLQLNYSDLKCWDDNYCDIHRPSVCVRQGW